MKPISFSLPDGIEVLVRGVETSDRGYFVEGFDALSKQSTYFRFNAYLSRLSDHQLDYLTRVDQETHAAIGVICKNTLDGDVAVGVGRFIRLEEDQHRAELALTVLDAYQRKGIGALMLAGLCSIAVARGVTSFSMQVHSTRHKLIRKLVHNGAVVERHVAGTSELTMPLNTFSAMAQAQYTHLHEAFKKFEVNWA